MAIEENKEININRIAILYRDLLSNTIHSLSEEDKQLLLSIKPKKKVLAIGDIDSSNWNSYALTYLLENKIIAPTVLDESKVYQSMHAMRTHDESIIHPQSLISQSVVIHIIGLDSSSNINEYLNSFISMCIANDKCKIIFVIIDGDKKFYKNSVFTRKSNSSFIDITSSDKSPYKIESAPLCISPDDIVFFNYSKKNRQKQLSPVVTEVSSSISIKRRGNKPSISDYDFI